MVTAKAKANKKSKKAAAAKRCSSKKVSTAMHEWKTGRLFTNAHVKVKSRKQAIAIALSEARRYCERGSVPKRKTRKSRAATRKVRKSR